jgi:hypothetical protein
MGLRLSQEIAVRVEAEAKQSGLATSELLRQIVTAHYESSQADEAASREKAAERRFQQLIFEIGKPVQPCSGSASRQCQKRSWNRFSLRQRATPRTMRRG